MRNRKRILYVGLGLLAGLVLLTLLVWSFKREDEYLIIVGILAVLFLCYFALLIGINVKTGWSDENTPYARVRSKEKLLVHLYPFKGSTYILVAYEPFPAAEFIHWLRTSSEEGDADMGPIGCVYIGYTKMKDYVLATLADKTVVLPAETENVLRADPRLSDFFKKNTVVPYES